MYTNLPNGNEHQKGPIWLWIAGEVTENQQIVEQTALFFLRPLAQQVGLPYLSEHLRLHPLLCNRRKKTKKKKMAQMKENIKAPEKKYN